MHRSQLASVMALGTALLLAASVADAQTVDFEDLGVAVGTQLNPAAGVGVISQGFNYVPGPNNASGFNDLHIDWDTGINASNGTVVGSSHDDVVLSQVGGGMFNLLGFDFAGFPGGEMPFSLTGTYFGGGTITQDFTPDGIVDSTGGAIDFQTFTMPTGWTGLVSVTWNHTGAGTIAGLFALDNIRTGAVPEPASLAALCLSMAFFVRRRK